jgi:hypothetical protein
MTPEKEKSLFLASGAQTREDYELFVSDKYDKIITELTNKLESDNNFSKDKLATDARLWFIKKFFRNYSSCLEELDEILNIEFRCTKYTLDYLELMDKDKVIGYCKIKSSKRSFEILECEMIELHKHDTHEFFNYLINEYDPEPEK